MCRRWPRNFCLTCPKDASKPSDVSNHFAAIAGRRGLLVCGSGKSSSATAMEAKLSLAPQRAGVRRKVLEGNHLVPQMLENTGEIVWLGVWDSNQELAPVSAWMATLGGWS
jgi:hypothetical protein